MRIDIASPNRLRVNMMYKKIVLVSLLLSLGGCQPASTAAMDQLNGASGQAEIQSSYRSQNGIPSPQRTSDVGGVASTGPPDGMDRAPSRAGDRTGQPAYLAFPAACTPQPNSPPASYSVQAARPGAKRFTLQCGLGLRQADVQWYIGGEAVEERFSNKVRFPLGGKGPISYGEFDLLKNGNLRVRQLTSGHEGLYHCRARKVSAGGNATTCSTVLLRLKAAPRPSREMYRRRVLASGRTSILACKMRGYPTPRIQWSKDGALIDSGNPRYASLPDGSLLIRHTSVVDEGQFVCIALNEIGRRLVSVHVSIVDRPNMEPPTIIKSPRSRRTRPGGSVTLTCSAVGGNLMEINWEFLGQNLSSRPLELRHRQLRNPTDDGLLTVVSELVVSSVSPEDVGQYTCTASNLSGRTTATATLSLSTQP